MSNKKRIIYTGVFLEEFSSKEKVYHQPMIRIVPPQDYKELDSYLANLEKYDYLLFSSRFCAIYFLERMREKQLSLPQQIKKIAFGKIIAKYLKEKGIIADYFTQTEEPEELAELFLKLGINNKKILALVSSLTPERTFEKLVSLGAKLDKLITYSSVKPCVDKKIDLNTIDEIYFLSPWGFDNFLEIYDSIPEHILIKAIGQPTLDYIRNKGYNAVLAK